MDFRFLIETYGYAAVFVGALLEGEMALVMGGFAAERGYLELQWVMAVAMVGGFLGDQIYFFIGRRYGNRILARFPRVRQRAVRVDEWLHRYHAPLIIGIRFMYGFRIIGPIIFGMGRVSAAKFVALNFIGACIWAVTVAGAGYVFSEALDAVAADARGYGVLGLGVVLLFAMSAWMFHRYRARKKVAVVHHGERGHHRRI